MADSDGKPASSRRNTSGATSRRSSTERGLYHVTSGNHLDDHSQYHGHHFHPDTEAIDDGEVSSDNGDADLSEKDSQDVADNDLQQETSEGTIDEIRDGIPNERDLEAGSKIGRTATVKSSKSRRSIRDANLVAWDGPDDPKNPKNWSNRRKWAATLTGAQRP
jgi:hypothetical protein